MPKSKNINSVLIIGAGPIIIGQACEFDYSGTQACKALKDEGYKVILINSNPATIMTDPEVADKTYIEPITIEILEKIIIKERPDAILPTMGGQTALNTTLDLNRHKILEKYNVEIIGASTDSIDMAEDRELFKNAMNEIGLNTPKSFIAHNYNDAENIQKEIGFPIIIRPSFTLGGSGGGIAYNKDDFQKIVKSSQKLENLSLYIDDSPNLSISALRTRARRLKRKYGLNLYAIYQTATDWASKPEGKGMKMNMIRTRSGQVADMVKSPDWNALINNKQLAEVKQFATA